MKRVSRLRVDLFVSAALFACAAGLRLYWAWRTHFPTMDTAIVGLMALDILEGARPMFFTGQGYMGALEGYLTAAVFALLSPGRVAMTLVPILFAGIWTVLMYRFLLLYLPRRGAVAGALAVAFPAEIALWYSTAPYGGYPEMYVFGTAMVLQAAARHASGRWRPWPDAGLFALLTFLGVWTNLQIVPFLATAGIVWLAVLWPARRRPARWLPFAMVPAALAAAVIPQLILSAANPSSPPLFEAASPRDQIAHSLRALAAHDLPALTTWRGGGVWNTRFHTLLYAGLLLSAALALFRRRNQPGVRGLTAITALYLAMFSLLYFPHPMSGFIPRYLIGPFVWVTATALGLAVGAPRPLLRRVGLALLLLWIGLQTSGFFRSAAIRRQTLRAREREVMEVVHAARSLDLDAVRILGSDMEGHQSSVYSFMARNRPVFSSSYDERRIDAARAWHRNPRAGYLFSGVYEPYVRGTLDALHLPHPPVVPAGSMRLMPPPTVSVPAARSLPEPGTPRGIPAGAERLFDRAESTAWPPTPSATGALGLEFDAPRRVAGLRFTTDDNHSFPYQYTVTGRTTGGEDVTLRDCDIRLGVGHLSGGRLYLKGYPSRMDLRWPARELVSLGFTYRTGGKNHRPVGFTECFVLVEAEPLTEEIPVRELEAWLASAPDARVLCDPAVTARLWREAPDLEGLDRLPAPWNPRDPATRPESKPPDPNRHVLLLVENPYAGDVRRILYPSGNASVSLGPFTGWRLPPREMSDRMWNGFALLRM